MSSTRMFLGMVVGIVAFAAGLNTAYGDDFLPPPWRGQPLTTLQGWEFTVPIFPSIEIAVHPPIGLTVGDSGGPPYANIYYMHWSLADGDGGWVADEVLNGFIDLIIPNWIDLEPRKLIHVQITYSGNEAPYIYYIYGSDNEVGVAGFPRRPPVAVGPNHVLERWEIQPNPDWERIQIFVPGEVLVDQIVVDTISFPEPASMALLALGGLAMTWRRRR